MIYCAICGVKCKEKYKEELNKKDFDLCHGCFNSTRGKSIKEIKELIKKSSL